MRGNTHQEGRSAPGSSREPAGRHLYPPGTAALLSLGLKQDSPVVSGTQEDSLFSHRNITFLCAFRYLLFFHLSCWSHDCTAKNSAVTGTEWEEGARPNSVLQELQARCFSSKSSGCLIHVKKLSRKKGLHTGRLLTVLGGLSY